MNRPASIDGVLIWDLFMRLGGQWRIGMAGATGLDLGMALQLGRALGIPDLGVAEFIPEMETAALAAMRTREDSKDGG